MNDTHVCNKGACASVGTALLLKLPINDLGEPAFYGGCVYEHNGDNGTVKISQSAFVEKIIDKFAVTRTVPTPHSSHVGR